MGTLPSIVKPQPMGKVQMETLVRNVRVDKIKVKAYRKFGIFEQTFMK